METTKLDAFNPDAFENHISADSIAQNKKSDQMLLLGLGLLAAGVIGYLVYLVVIKDANT